MHLKKSLLWIFFFAVSAAGCKKWDDHTTVNNQDLSINLVEAISQNPNLTKFSEYLQSTGLDKELSSSKTYTVWAPSNAALQSLDPAVVGDATRLRQFIANHISLQSYFTRNAQTALRVAMLNGKRVTFLNNKFDEANITEADKYVGNGVLHLIDKAAPANPNAWELVNNTRTSYQQNAFILSLTRKVFDPTNAIIDSINSQTGQPVYRPGTDSVLRNTFNAQVFDLQNEEKQYTYFILDDAAFNAEVARLTPYFKTSTTDSTKNLASNNVVKDLIVEGLYTIEQLPATLTSKFGVKIPIDKSKIIDTRKMSNGVAYVLSTMNFDVKDKIPAIVVQGEDYLRFLDPAGNQVTPRQQNVSAVFTRSRINLLTGMPFTDIFVYNHGITGLSAEYRATNIPSVKYKVYWVAVNDTLIYDRTNRVDPVTFNQRLAMGTFGANFLPTTPAAGMPVAPNTYSEIYLGDYTKSTYGTLNMFLAAPAATTGQPGGVRLNLDYIKLVPDL